MPAAERRKYVRLSAKYIAKCEPYSITAESGGAKTFVVTKNISAGGLLFESPKAYEVTSMIRLELNLPGWRGYISRLGKKDFAKDVYSGIATVVRIEVLDGGLYDVGVCFTGIDEIEQQALSEYLYSKDDNNA